MTVSQYANTGLKRNDQPTHTFSVIQRQTVNKKPTEWQSDTQLSALPLLHQTICTIKYHTVAACQCRADGGLHSLCRLIASTIDPNRIPFTTINTAPSSSPTPSHCAQLTDKPTITDRRKDVLNFDTYMDTGHAETITNSIHLIIH